MTVAVHSARPPEAISLWKNTLGAFADGAILFPLMATLSTTQGFSSIMLLGTAGFAYILSGILYRIPMPIQPLKAIAIAALTVGATVTEVRLSAALLGMGCLGLSFFRMNTWVSHIPKALIHGIQLSLGVILIQKSFELLGGSWGTLPKLPPWEHLLGFLGLSGLILYGTYRKNIPLLGMVATAGLFWAILFPLTPMPKPLNLHIPPAAAVRFDILLSLVLPQWVLTFSNSVVGTHDVAHRYFGSKAIRVTPRRLLQSIGIGNMCSALLGGLPFCHGSGGLTAHVRGGSSHWISNAIIGITLLGLAFTQLLMGSFVLNFPPVLLAGLLFSVGIFHISLAKPSWKTGSHLSLISMALATWITQNILWSLAAGCLVELTRAGFTRWILATPPKKPIPPPPPASSIHICH